MKEYKNISLIFLIILIIIISVFISLRYTINSSSSSDSLIGVKVSPSVYFQFKQLSQMGYNITNTSLLLAVQPTYATEAIDYNGKPVIIFVGAEWCPYCGAEMWAFIIALERFGNISGLEYMLSSSTDVYPNTPTFTIVNVTYQSPYLYLLEYEYQNRNHQPLQSIPANIYQLWQNLGRGSIPFVYVSGLYYQVGSTVNPSLLSGKNWSYVFQQLHNLSSPIAKEIYASANLLTAEFCIATDGKPYNVCGIQEIKHLESLLIQRVNSTNGNLVEYYQYHDNFKNVNYTDQNLSQVTAWDRKVIIKSENFLFKKLMKIKVII
ncbi:DUF929 family protein [Sulfolobaceae archaeon RB850M]